MLLTAVNVKAARKVVTASNTRYGKLHRATVQIMADIHIDKVLDTEPAKTTVKNCGDSIVTDPVALMLLAKLHNHDNDTTEHSLNVCVLKVTFGCVLGFNKKKLNNIVICGPLNDIGKI